jgi:hypothetical protein
MVIALGVRLKAAAAPCLVADGTRISELGAMFAISFPCPKLQAVARLGRPAVRVDRALGRLAARWFARASSPLDRVGILSLIWAGFFLAVAAGLGVWLY